MDQATFIGMLVIAIPSLIGLFTFAEKRSEKTHQLRIEQLQATHESTSATKELASELRALQGEILNISDRTTRLEDAVFYVKRKDSN